MNETPSKLTNEDRRAAALRENLLKRKTQMKERQLEAQTQSPSQTSPTAREKEQR